MESSCSWGRWLGVLVVIAVACDSGPALTPAGAAGAGGASLGAAGEAGTTTGAGGTPQAIGGSTGQSGSAGAALGGSAGFAGATAGTAGDPGDLPPSADAGVVDVRPRPIRALQIASGEFHNCALLEDHRVKCWGRNDYGQLGYGDTTSRGALATEMGDALPVVDLGTNRTALKIAAGRYSSCAVLDDATVKCWGYNYDFIPWEGDEQAHMSMFGDEPGEMGDALPTLDVGAGAIALDVVTGEAGGCVLLEGHRLSCWSYPGQFHDFDLSAPIQNLASEHLGALALLEDGTLKHLATNQVEPGIVATAFASAVSGWCAALSGGGVTCLDSGQAPPVGTLQFVAVGVGAYSAWDFCGTTAEGQVRCWGVRGGCNPGSPNSTFWCEPGERVVLDQPVVSFGSGSRYVVCGLLADGSVRCWGGIDECTYDDVGGATCVPDTVLAELGGSVEIKIENGTRSYGTWGPVDLGTLR